MDKSNCNVSNVITTITTTSSDHTISLETAQGIDFFQFGLNRIFFIISQKICLFGVNLNYDLTVLTAVDK